MDCDFIPITWYSANGEQFKEQISMFLKVPLSIKFHTKRFWNGWFGLCSLGSNYFSNKINSRLEPCEPCELLLL